MGTVGWAFGRHSEVQSSGLGVCIQKNQIMRPERSFLRRVREKPTNVKGSPSSAVSRGRTNKGGGSVQSRFRPPVTTSNKRRWCQAKRGGEGPDTLEARSDSALKNMQ